jgi:hypothetical protein
MPLFFVTYDLMKRTDYHTLWKVLEQYKAERVLLSTWALQGDYTALELRNSLSKFIDPGDRLLVSESAASASKNLLIELDEM